MLSDHFSGWKGLCWAVGLPVAISAMPLAAATDTASPLPNMENTTMWMTIGQQRFAITLEDNPATRELAARLPLSLDMGDLNNNEKHVTLQRPLPSKTYRPGTIHNGDVLLYGTDTLVVFYKTFNSPYSYTRLGRIDNPTGLAKALGPDDVRLTFSAD